ncbi:MAG TPA: glycosyltransferase [Candidatus Paceibacterota bacterium]|nr:glycosyltransferase [Candidatus Paceibacterota bacterium]
MIVLDLVGEYKEIIPDNVEVIDLGSRRAKNSIFKLRNVFLREKPDFVLATLPQISIVVFFASLLILKKPKIINRISNYYSKEMEEISFFNNFFYKKSLLNSYKIITLCEDMKFDLLNRLKMSENKVIVINNPLDLNFIYNIKKHIVKPPKDYPIILSCGRLVKQKGHEYLIGAMVDVVKHYPNAILKIIGSGPEFKYLNNLIIKLNLQKNVFLLGFVENPYKYMCLSDVFCLPSLWEGFPNSLIEAMACGIPVISTNCPTGPLEILENGKNGLLINVKNKKEISDGIIKIINNKNLASLFIKNSNIRVKDFDISKISIKYVNLF